MIPSFLTLEDNGTFSIGVTLASAIAIPATGIFALYAPTISSLLKNNKLDELNKKYKSTATLLLFLGGVLFTCIALGIENLFHLLPNSKSLMDSVPIILILGINVVINMATSFNGEIITYSKYYRFNLIAIVLLIVLNVGLNIWFLKYLHLGLSWVAVASLLSMVVFNASKMIYIYVKFKLFPFDLKFLKLVLVLTSVFVVCYFLPTTPSKFFDLLYKTGLNLVLVTFVAYRLQLVKELNEIKFNKK